MKRRSLAMIGMAMMTPAAGGYELGTHAFVSKVAFDASVLSPSNAKTVVPILGFDRLSETMPFSGFDLTATPLNRYWDDAPTGQVELETVIGSILRAPQNEEGKIFERLIASTYLPSTSRADFELRADAWVMRGAVREDDNDIGTLYSIGDRDADPRHTVFRAGRHFYDPVNERALTDGVTCFFFGCIRATEWAMGRSGVLDGPGTITADRENHYSWHDARNNYWWALTAKPALATTYGEMQRLNSGNRSMRWATTLKSVGQVIHLVQDMAQPQHTRNDSHGPPIAGLLSFSSRSDGTFEAYTEARLFLGLPPGGFESPFTHFDGNKLTSDNLPGLQLRTSSPYLTPSFSTPVEFFTTRESDESITARRGLSDVSNRGFFTSSTLPVNVTTGIPAQGPTAYLDPPNPDGSAFYEELPLETSLYADGSVVRMYQLVAPMPDVLDPNWNNQSGLFDDYSADGRMPLLAASQTRLGSDLIGSPTPETDSTKYTISYEVFTAMADAMLPRAVGYSTGLINFFFRGRLEVTPTAQNAFAVLNQGEPHTVDAEGYPRKPGGGIFGFEKVRLKVRNVSESITESGPATPAIPQTSGSGTLVAVARYHRNACYKPDMSGERVIAYAAPPTIGAITEPTCTAALPARTAYQEISVSAPIAISSSAGLPGGVGTGGNAPAAIEKLFDFSADPIPVNATDLFIQVVYRGQLGDEPDGIAVGTYDAREPTFVGIYNNTDYYWNVTMSEWVLYNSPPLFPPRNVDELDVCMGFFTASRSLYHTETVANQEPLGAPTPTPGTVRLAVIMAAPSAETPQWSVRVVSEMDPVPSAHERSYVTRGAIRQASKELIGAAVIAAPQYCSFAAPTGASYWCNDPIQQRRGLRLGHVVAPIYYDTQPGSPGTDVDSVPLPTFGSSVQHAAGTVMYNDASLSNCPPNPARSLDELLKAAAELRVEVD